MHLLGLLSRMSGDEGKEVESMKFMPQIKFELWSVISQMIKVKKNAHTRPLFVA